MKYYGLNTKERLMKWIEISDDTFLLRPELGKCWNWVGRLDKYGYGRTCYKGKRGQLAHRVLYTEMIGAIPDGLTLDHLCRNRKCINPSHLEPVTIKENNHKYAYKIHP